MGFFLDQIVPLASELRREVLGPEAARESYYDIPMCRRLSGSELARHDPRDTDGFLRALEQIWQAEGFAVPAPFLDALRDLLRSTSKAESQTLGDSEAVSSHRYPLY